MSWHCEVCDSYFESMRFLEEHSALVHELQLSEAPSERDDEDLPLSTDSDAKTKCCVCKRKGKKGDMTEFDCPISLPVTCHGCGEMMAKDHLVFHLAKHTETTFKCLRCDVTFESQYAAAEHHYLHWKNKEVSCGFCDEKPFQKRDLAYRYHKNKETLSFSHCNLCQKKICSGDRRKHLQVHAMEMTRGVSTFKDVLSQGRTVCGMCLGSFADTRVILGLQSKTDGVQCDVCGKMVGSCHFKYHMRCHKRENPWTCQSCGAKFRSPSSLKIHALIHSGHKPHVCAICKRAFRQKSQLATHLAVHTRERRFPCHICPKKFTTKSAASKHVLVHTKEQRYVCSFCSRGFQEQGALKVHLRTHTKEKPFSCEKCGKTFCHKVTLVKHHKCKTESSATS